jgi:hypothetical protein
LIDGVGLAVVDDCEKITEGGGQQIWKVPPIVIVVLRSQDPVEAQLVPLNAGCDRACRTDRTVVPVKNMCTNIHCKASL